MSFNLDELKELLELISAKDFAEFELEGDGVRLKIKRGVVAGGLVESSNNHPPLPSSVPLPPTPIAMGEAPASAPPEVDAGLTAVRSPMVGTFYRSPEPGAPPFVTEGDRVKPGQVLCIIEAMKLMNEIEAELAGEIVQVFVENGQPVQYGDPLFAIRAAS